MLCMSIYFVTNVLFLCRFQNRFTKIHIKMLKIIVTGPESVGKSTLATALSAHFKAVLSHEYARQFLETKLALQKLEKKTENASTYDESDFYKMFLGQKTNEKYALAKAKNTQNFIICDTDSLTYKIWYEEVFKNSDNTILQNIDFGVDPNPEKKNEGHILTLFARRHRLAA